MLRYVVVGAFFFYKKNKFHIDNVYMKYYYSYVHENSYFKYNEQNKGYQYE